MFQIWLAPPKNSSKVRSPSTPLRFAQRYDDEHHSSIINTRQYRGPEALVAALAAFVAVAVFFVDRKHLGGHYP